MSNIGGALPPLNRPHRRSDDPNTKWGLIWRIVSHPGPMLGAICLTFALGLVNAVACPHGPLHFLMPSSWASIGTEVEEQVEATAKASDGQKIDPSMGLPIPIASKPHP